MEPLEIVGNVENNGDGETVETMDFIVYDWAGNEVTFLQMPKMVFEGLSEEEMALDIEWNLTRTRNQLGMGLLAQNQIAIPDVVLMDKRMGFLIQWLIPSAFERRQFEVAWEHEMGDFIDGLKANLNRMKLQQGIGGMGPESMNRQQRREWEREQLRLRRHGN